MRTHPSRTVLLMAFALALGLAGCASSGGGGGGDRVPGATANRIVRAELEPIAQLDAYQAIARLRPRWLRSRSGVSPVLYVDQARRSDLNDLRQLRVTDIDEIEFMSSGDATTRFGTGHSGGAILVATR